jgi:beta propeller repeat protein
VKGKFALFLIFTSYFFLGCTVPEGVGGTVVCDSPYIRHGSECCLDQNNNSICDTDEGTVVPDTSEEENETEEPEIETNETEEETELCISEGGSIAVIPDPPSCCAGLTLIPPKDSQLVGSMGICTAKCGNGVCDSTTETNYNCPADCTAIEVAPVDPCADVQCSSGSYCLNGTCLQLPQFSVIPLMTVEMYSYCGDDICSSSENSSGDCCSDCGCASGSYCSNNTCVQGTAPLFALVYVPMVAYFPPTEKLLSDGDPSSCKAPSISGNRIVYSEIEGTMYYEGKIYDSSSDSLQVIPHADGVNDPDIYGGRIVWTDYGLPSEGTGVYYYDFAGGTQGYVSVRPTYKYQPKIFNNAIIWEEQVEDGSDYGGNAIYLFWIPGAQETKIFHNKDKTPNGHAIYGADVIISTFDCSDGVPCPYELWRYDISTQDTDRIVYTDQGAEIHSPSTWDGKVAYISGNDQYAQVYVYTISSGTTQKITNVNSEKIGTAIYQNKVVWADERNGNWDIYMYDLSTGNETRLTTDTKDDWKPDINGDTVAWIRGGYSSAPQNVYMKKI